MNWGPRLRSYFAEWILDEGGGVRIYAEIRDDFKSSGITERDLCLEASVPGFPFINSEC